jgi:hypothetical protein
MRKVAAFALFSDVMSYEFAESRYQSISKDITAWLDVKGDLLESPEGLKLVLRDGRVADYEVHCSHSNDCKLLDHNLTEPLPSVLLHTIISVACLPNRVIVYVELQAAGGAYHLGPLHVDIRSPRIVRDLVGKYDDWHVGETPLSAKPFKFIGNEGASRLASVLWHPKRNLPVLVVSSYEDNFLTKKFAEELATDLIGVAIVATIDATAAWELTAERGKDWSCYNGAVRLYWPQLGPKKSPLDNPLWTRFSLLSHGDKPQASANAFRHQIRKQLLGLSAFVVLEPLEFISIRSAHSLAMIEAARQPLRNNDDWEGLANSYAAENTELRKKLEDRHVKVADLEAEVANLQLSLQWRPQEPGELVPEVDLPPSTVQEALEKAIKDFSDFIIFGTDVNAGIQGLASDAGPPEKIYSYFKVLARMVVLRRGHGLGLGLVPWLLNQGVNVSGESETVKGSAVENRKRTWNDGHKDRVFDLHLKPTEGTSPNRCVRIYFDYDDSQSIAVVGWVGRHL